MSTAVPPPDAAATTCAKCGVSLAPFDDVFLFVERPCVECGKPTYLRNVDPKTGGVKIEKGDTPHVSIRMLQQRFKLTGGLGSRERESTSSPDRSSSRRAS
jgi:hypothetical protein